MKILYSVQATGNGHISRAMELVPLLQHEARVDVFLSGGNSSLQADLPIRFRSNGLSLYYNCSGGLDYRKMIRNISPFRIRKEIRELPVEQYDLVINDFEYITAAACRLKQVPSIQVGHQASFQSKKTPRPDTTSRLGEWILQNYAKASHYLGLHFQRYDQFILPPVIKAEIREARTVDHGHITVYLPSWCEHQLRAVFSRFPGHRFEIFSRETRHRREEKNLVWLPVEKAGFNQSFIHCHGIITGAGFETPAEALALRKKMICIPIRGQYEQICNAAALKKLGVTCLDKIDDDFPDAFNSWMDSTGCPDINIPDVLPELVDQIFAIHSSMPPQRKRLAKYRSANQEDLLPIDQLASA